MARFGCMALAVVVAMALLIFIVFLWSGWLNRPVGHAPIGHTLIGHALIGHAPAAVGIAYHTPAVMTATVEGGVSGEMAASLRYSG